MECLFIAATTMPAPRDGLAIEIDHATTGAAAPPARPAISGRNLLDDDESTNHSSKQVRRLCHGLILVEPEW
jgi:hypothetical protein